MLCPICDCRVGQALVRFISTGRAVVACLFVLDAVGVPYFHVSLRTYLGYPLLALFALAPPLEVSKSALLQHLKNEAAESD